MGPWGLMMLVGSADGEHVEGYGRRPGLFAGAQRLALERLESLGESAIRELLQGLAAHVLGPCALAGA
jgi:hypothetical protein